MTGLLLIIFVPALALAALIWVSGREKRDESKKPDGVITIHPEWDDPPDANEK